MSIINAYPNDHKILCICHNIPCDPMWAETFKIIFNWANTQGLNGIKAYDLQIIDPPGNDPINQKIWVKCRIEKVKNER